VGREAGLPASMVKVEKSTAYRILLGKKLKKKKLI